ncbi:YARHG domain-containing protein [Eubacteriales bacterium OttesenSCG-928-N13]|nr:YARHG domain-containing protein [Eubacteriales bacterium OttesenSCG-928-N13]
MKRKLLALLLMISMLLPTAALADDYYIIDDSDVRKLSQSELRVYSLSELGYARNEILARHGFPFKTETYRDYFENQDWYYRDNNFAYDWLSSIEMTNVETIKKIEAEKQGSEDDDDDDDDSDDYVIEDSDTRLLTKSELRKCSLAKLGYARNEILARHGYPFETKKYRDYFEDKWWYTRDEGFEYGWLNSTEMKNVELIKKIEQEKN